MKNYEVYCLDTESTGLDSIKNDVIELSIYKLSNDEQKTWFIKPINTNNIDIAALRINKHKMEDITHKTKYGIETYLDANKVIIDIENWLSEDNLPCENRVMLAQNVRFDYNMLEQLWIKCNSKESFPFGRRCLDLMQIEFFFDFCNKQFAEGYSLSNIIKKYGVVNSKAHSASADTLATKQAFDKQVEYFRKLLKNA